MGNMSRREAVRATATLVAGFAATGAVREVAAAQAPPTLAPAAARIRFGVIGINHAHINSQVAATIRGGGEFVSFWAPEADLAASFARRFPQAKRVTDRREILEDPSIQLVLSSIIPNQRAPLGIEVMRHGKDYMVDKPGITTLEQLAEVRRVQQETKRIYSIMYSERLENRATVKAGELARAGAIGDIIQTTSVGPHRINPETRPAWFFDHDAYGGILCDIGSHQFDQFLYFTNSKTAEIIGSQVGNTHHPQWPGLEDFGDVTLRGDRGSGYIQVHWFTPKGLPTWGDGRLIVLGSEGYMELRKYVDIGGRPGGDHLFLVDQKGVQHIDCGNVELPYGKQLVDDVVNRTETAMGQEHCFMATQLALTAQKNARRIGPAAEKQGG
jgi:predicted dehydrogenase